MILQYSGILSIYWHNCAFGNLLIKGLTNSFLPTHIADINKRPVCVFSNFPTHLNLQSILSSFVYILPRILSTIFILSGRFGDLFFSISLSLFV